MEDANPPCGSGTSGVTETPQHKHLRVLPSNKLQLASPEFTIYHSPDIDLALTQSTEVSNDVINKLVRGTVSNMISVCQCLPIPRYPNKHELQQMAITLVSLYPVLKDKHPAGKENYVSFNSFLFFS